MATLYEIDQRIADCFASAQVDEETGEVTLDEEKLAGLEMERKEKLENIFLLIKNLKSDKKACKDEKDYFAKKEKALQNQIDSLTNYAMNSLAGEVFKTIKVSTYYKNSKSIEVADAEKLPKEFQRIKVEADKTAIGEALKEGYKFADGLVKEVEKTSLVIR